MERRNNFLIAAAVAAITFGTLYAFDAPRLHTRHGCWPAHGDNKECGMKGNHWHNRINNNQNSNKNENL